MRSESSAAAGQRARGGRVLQGSNIARIRNAGLPKLEMDARSLSFSLNGARQRRGGLAARAASAVGLLLNGAPLELGGQRILDFNSVAEKSGKRKSRLCDFGCSH